MAYIISGLFREFWPAVCAGSAVAVHQGHDENGNAIGIYAVMDDNNNKVFWPGEKRLQSVLKRPIYDVCLQDIEAHFARNSTEKLYYTIQGSSGMGKTEFIGFLVDYLARSNRSIRIHYSWDMEEYDFPDIWLWVDAGNQPHVEFSNTTPLGAPATPYCFITDTYPKVIAERCSHLHVHIGTMDLSTEMWAAFASNCGTHMDKLYPPFSRSEHLWCRGNWRTLADAGAQHQQALANAVTAVTNAHPPSSLRNVRHRNKEDARINAERNSAIEKVNTQFARKWTATLAACAAAGGDNTVGVWTNWEELQIHYDVFGGCIRTLCMPRLLHTMYGDVERNRQLLEEYFSTMKSASGRLICEEYEGELEACAQTLTWIVSHITNIQKGTVNRAIASARIKSLFEVAVLTDDNTLKFVESSVFLSAYLYPSISRLV